MTIEIRMREMMLSQRACATIDWPRLFKSNPNQQPLQVLNLTLKAFYFAETQIERKHAATFRNWLYMFVIGFTLLLKGIAESLFDTWGRTFRLWHLVVVFQFTHLGELLAVLIIRASGGDYFKLLIRCNIQLQENQSLIFFDGRGWRVGICSILSWTWNKFDTIITNASMANGQWRSKHGKSTLQLLKFFTFLFCKVQCQHTIWILHLMLM